MHSAGKAALSSSAPRFNFLKHYLSNELWEWWMTPFLRLAVFGLFQLLSVGYWFWTPECNFFFSKQRSFNIDFNTKRKNPQTKQKLNKKKLLPLPKAEGRDASPQITTAALHLQFRNISVTDYIYWRSHQIPIAWMLKANRKAVNSPYFYNSYPMQNLRQEITGSLSQQHC